MRNTIIRAGLEALYFSGAHLLLRPFFGGVGVIFMLHHVRPPRYDSFQPNRLLEVTPDFLRDVIRMFRRSNMDVVSLDEMHRRLTERDFRRRFACITFDDGYRDNKTWAYPILKESKTPFAIYIPTSFPDRLGRLWWLALERLIAQNSRIALLIDGQERHFDCDAAARKQDIYDGLYGWLRELPTAAARDAAMNDLAVRYGIDMTQICTDMCLDWREISELAADPLVTIGAHTINHIMLSKASEDVARSELRTGRAVIEAALGAAPRHLAYPFGGRDTAGAREFRIAAELGFATAVTTRPGVLYASHGEYLTALPRISLNGQFQQIRYVRVLASGAATALWNGFRRVDAA